jgi:ATP-binding cassette subfamily C protein LapB
MASSTTDTLLKLWPSGARMVAPLLLATFAINLLGLALPLATLQIYDRVLAQGAHSSWIVTICMVLVAVATEAWLRVLRTHLTGWCGSVQEQRLTMAFLKHMFSVLPQGGGPGDSLHMLEALMRLREFSSGQALTVLLEVPFVVLYLGVIAYLGGILALVPLGMLLLFYGRVVHHGQLLSKGLLRRDHADIVRKNTLIEILERIQTIKAFGRQRHMQRVMDHHQEELAQSSLQAAEIANLSYQDGLLFGELVLVGVTMAGTPLVLSGHVTLGVLMACVLIAGRLMSPIQRALGLYSRVREARQAVQRLSHVLTQPPAFGTMVTPSGKLMGTLRLHNVSLKQDHGPWLARQIDLQAERGQTIAIQASSDSAGSYLLQTCAGLRPPVEGSIKINGIDPHQLASAELVRHVGYLPPQGTIYRGTIYDNLSRFGLTPRQQVNEIVELLELDNALSVLPRGMNTPLEGTLADPLPPGLKQRIALARTLALKPRIILFHQADRALDSVGYNTMCRLLGRLCGKALMLLLTDDRNLRALADCSFVQQGGTFTLVMHGRAPLPEAA